MKRNTLNKEKRIKTNAEYKIILKKGRRVRDKNLTIYIVKNKCGFSRLGVSVGRAYGNAVKRNKFKRLVREIFRQNQDKIQCGCDYLVMTKIKAPPEFDKIKKAFLDLTVLDSGA